MTIAPNGAGASAPENASVPETAPELAPMAAPVPGGWRAFAREDVERLHKLYYDPRVQVGEIAEVFRVSTSTLLRWIAEMKWPSRRQMRREAVENLRAIGRDLHEEAGGGSAFAAAAQDENARKNARSEEARISAGLDALAARADAQTPQAEPAPFAPPPLPDVAEPVSPARLALEIETAVRRELALVGASAHDRTPAARERNARTLAALVRALHGLRDIRGSADVGSESPAEKPPLDMRKLRDELEANLARIQAQKDAAREDEGKWRGGFRDGMFEP